MARKPLSGTVAANVLAHGTGALNIDGCRVPGDVPTTTQGQAASAGTIYGADQRTLREFVPNSAGRWPSNVVLTHAPNCADECAPGCPVAELDAQSGTLTSGALKPYKEEHVNASAYQFAREKTYTKPADSGGASRFFPTFRYEAKAPASERPKVNGTAHPTVKPVALMRWLVRLVTPPGGTVLDPFLGSGTTADAARMEGFRCIGIERDVEYLDLIKRRLVQGVLPFGEAS
jgi:site-specific DNA-methyltransferase (adenine-specific)